MQPPTSAPPRRKEIPSVNGGAPEVSIIIACRNEENVLGDLLDSLVEQTWTGAWEIIVADNGSTDETVRVAEAYAERLPIKMIDAGQKPGQSYARNRGVEASRGRLLLFCDGDDVMGPHYVEMMVEALRDHPYVGGHERHSKINAPWLQVKRKVENKVDGLIRSDYLPFVAGCTIGLRREALAAVNGFDESVTNCNDMDLSWRLAEAGIRPTYVPEAEFFYRARPTLWTNVMQEYNVARGYARVHHRHGQAHAGTGDPKRYLLREARALLRKAFGVRSWGDLLLLCRQAAWTAGLAKEAFRDPLPRTNPHTS